MQIKIKITHQFTPGARTPRGNRSRPVGERNGPRTLATSLAKHPPLALPRAKRDSPTDGLVGGGSTEVALAWPRHLRPALLAEVPHTNAAAKVRTAARACVDRTRCRVVVFIDHLAGWRAHDRIPPVTGPGSGPMRDRRAGRHAVGCRMMATLVGAGKRRLRSWRVRVSRARTASVDQSFRAATRPARLACSARLTRPPPPGAGPPHPPVRAGSRGLRRSARCGPAHPRPRRARATVSRSPPPPPRRLAAG